MRNVPHRLMGLNIVPQAGVTVLVGLGTFRKLSLAGGSDLSRDIEMMEFLSCLVPEAV